MYLEFYGILNQNLNFMSFVSNAVRDLLLIFDNFYSPKLLSGHGGGGGPLNTHFIRFLQIYFRHGNKFNYLSQSSSSSITDRKKPQPDSMSYF